MMFFNTSLYRRHAAGAEERVPARNRARWRAVAGSTRQALTRESTWQSAVEAIDPIRYGILPVINLERVRITPPVGMNLFTIKAITGSPMAPIVRGSLPYVVLMILVMALVMVWPDIALWLPGTMMSR